MNKQPVILDNYFSQDEVDQMLYALDKMKKPSHAPNMMGTLGFRTSIEAASVSMDNPVTGLTGDKEVDASILKTTESILRVKDEMEKFFDMELSMINCNYTAMFAGASNPLHADSSNLDGTPVPESKELEYSALIYLNDQGVDYTGGVLSFPLQDLNVQTKTGMVVFFKGDYNYPHEVSVVESGERKVIILFYARGGNISNVPLFSHAGAGVPVEDLPEEERLTYLDLNQ